MAGKPEIPFDEAAAAEIVAQVAEGRSLRWIAQQEHSPASLRTIMRWSASNTEFYKALAMARVDRAAAIAEEAIEIADEAVQDQAQATRNRTRVAARQWLAARLDPARWADKVRVAAELDATEEEMSPLEVARRLAFMLALGEDALKDDKPAAAPLLLEHRPTRAPPPVARPLHPDPPRPPPVDLVDLEQFGSAEEQGLTRPQPQVRTMPLLSVLRRPDRG